MEASLRQFYEKKIQRLEIDNFHLQEELYSRPTDQYKLKYQLLLNKVADENQLKESKRSEQIQNHEKVLASVNSKWQNILQTKTNELKATIQQIQNENKALSIKNTELEMKSVRLQRQIDEGDSQILKLKFDSIKKQNQRLKKQIAEAYNHCQKQISQIKLETEQRIEEVKQRQKICYRQQIQDLQKRIFELSQELQQTKIRASPEREVSLQEFQKSLLREKQRQTEQIVRMASILQTRNKQIKSIKQVAQRKDEMHMSNIKQLSQKLKNYETKLFEASLERQMALLELKKELENKRAKQADELKEQLSRVMYGFQRERQEWRHIISEFETQNGKIKKDWQEQKLKYVEEKKILKDKIAELRKRLNQNEERAKDETEKLLKSLRDLHSNQQQFTNYENGITFMDRQVRKSTIKIREQDIEINNLLTQLKTLQQQTQKQIAYTREKAREEVKQLYDKVFALEDQNDRLQVQLKQLEKVLKRKEKEIEVQKEGHKEDIAHYKLIIQQMDRDYKRVASHKKSLEDSYRQERENVITSKIDINQERKSKWTVLARQKSQLQLIFRERQNQIRSNYQVEIDKLKRQKHDAIKEMESFRAQNQALKQRLEQKQNLSKQSSYSDYQAKLATLDLQLALTQNLFKNLSKVTAKKQPHLNIQLLELSQQSSVRMASEHELHPSGQDLLKYGSFYVSNEDPNRIGFSFCPPKKT